MNMTLGHEAVTRMPHDARRPERRPVDLVHLARQTFGNRALEREVLELFLTHIPRSVARLHAASTDQAWRDAAHAITGSARAIGAWSVAEVSAGAERLSGAALDQGKAAAIALLEKRIGEAAAFIRGLLIDA